MNKTTPEGEKAKGEDEEIIHEDGEVFIEPPMSDDLLAGLFLDLGEDPCSQ